MDDFPTAYADCPTTYEVTYRSEWTTEVDAHSPEEAQEIAENWVLESLGNYFHLDHEEIEVHE